MGQRFTQLINHLGISRNAFATSLDKTATVIQHLVDERNKPGFDLLCKVFEVYPNVSKEWLLQGVGPMLVTEAGTLSAPTSAAKPDAATPETTSSAPAQLVAAPVTAALTASATPATQAASAPEEPAAPAPVVAAAPVLSAEPIPAAQVDPVPVAAPVAAPTSPAAPAATPDTSWQTALYTQQMAHQLALAELRNQHLQEQQRLMQQMMDLMQRQLGK